MVELQQVNTFFICPKKYYLKYIKKEECKQNINNFVDIFVKEYIKTRNNNFDNLLFNLLNRFNFIFLENNFLIDVLKKLNITEGEKNEKNIKLYIKEEYKKYLFDDEIEELKTKTNRYINLFDTAKEICKKIDLYFFNNIEFDKIIEDDDMVIKFDTLYDNIVDIKIVKRERESKKNIKDLIVVYFYYKKYNFIPKIKYIDIIYNNKNEVSYEIKEKWIEFNKNDIEIVKEYLDSFKKCIDNNIFYRNLNTFYCSENYCEFYNKCLGGE